MSRKPPGAGRPLPFQEGLRDLLEKFRRKDANKFFEEPVDAREVPEYYEHITNPMCFSTMGKKIECQQYSNLDAFKADLKLVCDNCKYFNDPSTVYYKAADSLQRAAKTMFANCNIETPVGQETPKESPRESPREKREITPRRVSPRLKKESPRAREARESPRSQSGDFHRGRSFLTPQASPNPSYISPVPSHYSTPQPAHRFTTPQHQFMPDHDRLLQPPSPHLKREWPEPASLPSHSSSQLEHHDFDSSHQHTAMQYHMREQQERELTHRNRSPPIYERKKEEVSDNNEDRKRKISKGTSKKRDTAFDRQRLSAKQALGAGINFETAQPPTNMDLYHLWQMEQQLQRATRQPAAARTLQQCTPSHTRVGPVLYDRYRPFQDLPYVEKYVQRSRRFVKDMPSIVQELVEDKLNLITQVGKLPEPEQEVGYTPPQALLELVNDAEFKPIFHAEEPFGIPKDDLLALDSLAELGVNLNVHKKLLIPQPKLEAPLSSSAYTDSGAGYLKQEPQAPMSSHPQPTSFQQAFQHHSAAPVRHPQQQPPYSLQQLQYLARQQPPPPHLQQRMNATARPHPIHGGAPPRPSLSPMKSFSSHAMAMAALRPHAMPSQNPAFSGQTLQPPQNSRSSFPQPFQ